MFIVIPTFNEGNAISSFFASLDREIQEQKLKATLVVVDDGSTDESKALLGEISDKGKIQLLRHDVNYGVAKALETGIKWVLKKADLQDILVVLEADGTNDIKILSKLCDRIDDGFDVVIGSRHLDGGGIDGFPLLRRTISKAGNFTMRLAIGYPGVCDYTIFYRAYRISAINDMANNSNGSFFREKGFAANAELLLQLASKGGRITEIPHFYRYHLKQSTSKMDLGQTVLGYLSLINRFRHPIKNALITGRPAD